MSSLFNNLKKLILKTIHPQSGSFERRFSAQTQDLQIFKKFNMSQMNPKEVFHNTATQFNYLSRSLTLKGLGHHNFKRQFMQRWQCLIYNVT